MERRPGPVGLLACAAVVLPACLPAISQAAEVWAVRGGTTTISLDSGAIERLGLKAEGPAPEICPSTDRQCRLVFPVRGRSTLTFVLADGGRPEFLDGRILHFGSLSVATPEQEQSLCDFVIAPLDGRSFDRLQVAEAVGDRLGGFVLDRIKLGFDRGSRTLTIHSGSLYVSPVWAEALGAPGLAEHSLGTVTVEGVSEWLEGTGPEAETEAASDDQPRDVGCDMTFCQLYDLEQFGREGDIVGLAIATTSWNLGDADCLWFPIPSEDHPFIVMNLYREKDDRFEQIGQSWVKHGFYALGNTQCGGTCTFEDGHSAGSWLGTGCTDTYSSALNAAQNGLGPRYEINPWTGAWTYEGSHLSGGSHYHDGIEHRLQVYDNDLDPALNPDATYYGEGFYAMLDDADAMNSASWKPAPVSGSPGGTWTFSMSAAGYFPNIGFAIDAWIGAQQTVIAQEVPPVEFVSPDGRCVLAAKATDLGGDLWHYEYALLNVDMDRQVGSFSIPLPAGINVTNVDFHAVHHHDEPFNEPGGVPIDNASWDSEVTAEAVTWSTTTNPLRWGTLYNFRFDADVGSGQVVATLGLFKAGTPSTLEGTTLGPTLPAVCGDGVVEADEQCDPPGGECDADCKWLCGDGVAHPPEEPCDAFGEDTEDCDADCTLAECGDGYLNALAGEECDEGGETATCDFDCTPVECGDGYVNQSAGEECDPPNGVTCDDNCQRIPTCGDGFLDPGEECDDGNNEPGDGCDEDCQIEDNDICEQATAVVEGVRQFNTTGVTTDGPDEPEMCDFGGYTHVESDIWYCYTASCNGQARISLCGSDYDTKLAVYAGCVCPTEPSAIACDDNSCMVGITLQSELHIPVEVGGTYLIRIGGYFGDTGPGMMTIQCNGDWADPLRGGQLWDEWWEVIFAAEPTGEHPLYPPAGQQSGSITYRCKECHGWDYKGADGAYGSGPHYTGIPGVYGSTMSSSETFDLIKLDSVPNGHGFENYGLSDQDVWDLVGFMNMQVIDTDDYICGAGLFLGDPQQGQVYYEYEHAEPCVQCHGWDGTMRNFGTAEDPEWLGTVAVEDPWRMLHKTRFGNPGTPMPSWLADDGTDQEAMDIDKYAQMFFPVDCLEEEHCDDGDWCNGQETCVFGYCQAGEPPPAEIDCNGNGVDDRCDPPGDFNDDGPIDLDDYAGLYACTTGPCENPPCDPWLYLDDCCVIADFEQDGDVDLTDVAAFQRVFGVECTRDAHCDDGDWCNGQETCVAGHCQAGEPPAVEIDCNANGVDDRCDPPGDFDADGTIDLDDYAGLYGCLTGSCGNPVCDPPLYAGDECCVIADFEKDGDVDLGDFAAFQSAID